MSFYAELNVSGQKYRVLSVSYDFNKPTDQFGKPNGVPQGGNLFLTIESSHDTGPIKWMLSYDTVKEGDVSFMRRDSSAVMRKIRFENAHCISLSESFSDKSEEPMTISMMLSCGKLDIDGNKYDKTVFWGGKNNSTAKSADNASGSTQEPASGGVSSFIAD